MTYMCNMVDSVAYFDNKIKAAVSKAVEHTGYSSVTPQMYGRVTVNFLSLSTSSSFLAKVLTFVLERFILSCQGPHIRS